MLSPEPMRHLSVVVLADRLEVTTRAIAAVGVLHLLSVRHATDALPAIRPYEVGARLAQLDALAGTLDGILRELGIPPPDADAADTGLDVPVAQARAAAIAGELEGLRARRSANGDGQHLRDLLPALRALAPLACPLGALPGLRYVHVVFGWLPERELPALRERLSGSRYVIELAGSARPDGRVFVVALCLRADQATVDAALRAAHFERLDLPAHLDGSPDVVVTQVEAELDRAREREQAIDAERAALAARVAPEARQLRALVERERLLARAQGLMGRSERVALVTGWVPAELSQRLEQVIRDATGGRCVVQWQEPAALEGVRRGRIPVPILLHNPVLIRPFERLLRAYGLPRYGELEPTPIVALAFLGMFGFMFGDVGQGAILFLIGYFVYRRMFRYRDFAVILMECGVFATAFGFLYGSVFGIESLLPALWLRPLEDIPRLVTTALAFGVVLLSIGLLMNLANAVRRRDPSALWERNGLLGAVAYWIAAGLFFRRVTGGPGSVTLGTAVLWLFVPVAAMFLKEPVRTVWTGVREGRWPDASDSLSMVIRSLVEILETAMSTLSNTATFIRLAAFALSHAGLFLATFSVADAVAHTGGGTVAAVLVVIVGNAVIIALEGMIVAIQTIRLEYYELFSKFYSGGGEEYRPLRLPAALAGREPARRAHA